MRLTLGALVLALMPGCFVDRSAIEPGAERDAQVSADAGPGATDADGDGVPVEEDCDDGDASIGRNGSRGCTSGCGMGTEICAAGSWGACSAPTTCACTDGQEQDIPCGACGTQRQRCAANTWVDDGACSGEGECAPGATADEVRVCGACGSETYTRSCSDACAWGEGTGSGVCSGGGVCTAGASEERSQPCGSCGTKSQRRSCTGSCAWGDWADVSECTGEGECSPGDVEISAQPCGDCSSGSRSVTRTCAPSCEWGTAIIGPCTGVVLRCRDRDGDRTICQCTTATWGGGPHICCGGEWLDGTSCMACGS